MLNTSLAQHLPSLLSVNAEATRDLSIHSSAHPSDRETDSRLDVVIIERETTTETARIAASDPSTNRSRVGIWKNI